LLPGAAGELEAPRYVLNQIYFRVRHQVQGIEEMLAEHGRAVTALGPHYAAATGHRERRPQVHHAQAREIAGERFEGEPKAPSGVLHASTLAQTQSTLLRLQLTCEACSGGLELP
jgi:hypothetical protein